MQTTVTEQQQSNVYKKSEKNKIKKNILETYLINLFHKWRLCVLHSLIMGNGDAMIQQNEKGNKACTSCEMCLLWARIYRAQ